MNKRQVLFIIGLAVVGLVIGFVQRGSGSILSAFSQLINRELEWSLAISGDVIPARSVNSQMTAKNDFLWPMRGISTILAGADITLINLESPLIANCPLTNEGFVFCGDQRFVNSLALAGVDVVNLANNHTLNYGWDGIAQTERLLAANNIATTGITTTGPCANTAYACSKQTVREIAGLNIGFLGYTIVGRAVDRIQLAQDISVFDQPVDVLVVSFHWGDEYTREPVGSPDDPVEIAHVAVDNGADVVVGNHPHWVQGQQTYKGAEIFYALGNTVFDQEWSTETKQGIIAQLNFVGTQVIGIDIVPIGIRNYGEAYVLTGDESQNVLRVFDEASALLQ